MEIKIENLSKIYLDKTPFRYQALDDVSFEINKGEFVGIIGSTGSGKSTLTLHFSGLLKPSQGRVHVGEISLGSDDNLTKANRAVLKTLNIDLVRKPNGKKERRENFTKLLRDVIKGDDLISSLVKNYVLDLVGSELDSDVPQRHLVPKYILSSAKKEKIHQINDLRKHIGNVFQFPEYQLFEETVLKDVMFGPINFGFGKVVAKEKATYWLKKLNVPEEAWERSPFDLSGGQKRKVAIAGILAFEPDVIVFDEPTAGLDPESEKDVLEICDTLNKMGKTIVLVTHNMDNILKHTHKVFVLNKGKLSRSGTPVEIFGNRDLVEGEKLKLPMLYDFYLKYTKQSHTPKEITNMDELVSALLRKDKPKSGGSK